MSHGKKKKPRPEPIPLGTLVRVNSIVRDENWGFLGQVVQIEVSLQNRNATYTVQSVQPEKYNGKYTTYAKFLTVVDLDTIEGVQKYLGEEK